MELVTEDKRIGTYRNASEVIRDLYASDVLAEKITDLFTNYAPAGSRKHFSDSIGDVILGFYKIADLPRLLQKNVGLSADESQRITSELIEFLSPVVKREEEEGRQKKEDLSKLEETFRTPEKKSVETEETTESELAKVASVRTMKNDATRAHGYGSLPENQDDEEGVIKALNQDETLRR